jgi:hypothetical protein
MACPAVLGSSTLSDHVFAHELYLLVVWLLFGSWESYLEGRALGGGGPQNRIRFGRAGVPCKFCGNPSSHTFASRPRLSSYLK